MLIRRYKSQDREALRHVYLETRKKSFEWLNSESLTLYDFDGDSEGEAIWVCEIEGGIVGFVSAQEEGRFIHHLFVLPEFSNLGYGARLLEVCLENIGYPAQLKCVAKNSRALSFYKANGWHTVSKAEGTDVEYYLMEVTEHNKRLQGDAAAPHT